MSLWEFIQSKDWTLAFAGLAGASVSAVMEWEGWMPSARRIFVGFIAAWYLGPIGLPFFVWASNISNLPPEHAISVGGFLVGIGGMSIVEFIIKVWKNLQIKGARNDND